MIKRCAINRHELAIVSALAVGHDHVCVQVRIARRGVLDAADKAGLVDARTPAAVRYRTSHPVDLLVALRAFFAGRYERYIRQLRLVAMTIDKVTPRL